jgi:hypothetical protein
MQYKNEVYVSDLWNILKKQGNKIIIAEDTYLHPGAFIFYIEQLETQTSYFLTRVNGILLICSSALFVILI